MARAQRLWLLERPVGGSGADTGDDMNFAGAVAVLDRAAVYVLVIISSDANRASERGLIECGHQIRLDRDAFRYDTLDDALDGLERIRQLFVARGWRDHEQDTVHAEIDPDSLSNHPEKPT